MHALCIDLDGTRHEVDGVGEHEMHLRRGTVRYAREYRTNERLIFRQVPQDGDPPRA
jgi:hypothetical protein